MTRPKRAPSSDGTVCGCMAYVPDCERCKLRVVASPAAGAYAFFSTMSWPVPGSRYDSSDAYAALVHKTARERAYVVRMLRAASAISDERLRAAVEQGR